MIICRGLEAAAGESKRKNKKMMMLTIRQMPGHGGRWVRQRDQWRRNKLQLSLFGSTPCRQTEGSMKSTSLVTVALLLPTITFAAENPSDVFLKKAIEGNYAEIQMGQLAQQKGQSDGVKKFGQMLSDDHSAANQKATAAAQSI